MCYLPVACNVIDYNTVCKRTSSWTMALECKKIKCRRTKDQVRLVKMDLLQVLRVRIVTAGAVEDVIA